MVATSRNQAVRRPAAKEPDARIPGRSSSLAVHYGAWGWSSMDERGRQARIRTGR